jgi:signal peptidase I
MKFKKGDIVKFEGAYSYSAKKGATAIVEEYYTGWNDEEWEDQYDFVSDNERDYAELLVQNLSSIFPNFKFETSLEKW